MYQVVDFSPKIYVTVWQHVHLPYLLHISSLSANNLDTSLSSLPCQSHKTPHNLIWNHLWIILCKPVYSSINTLQILPFCLIYNILYIAHVNLAKFHSHAWHLAWNHLCICCHLSKNINHSHPLHCLHTNLKIKRKCTYISIAVGKFLLPVAKF